MEDNQQSFWQFSDQLRLQTSNLANLSLNDPIWSSNYTTKRPDERINFDIKVGGAINSKDSDFNDGWKMANNYSTIGNGSALVGTVGLNGGVNKGIYSKPGYVNLNHNIDINLKGKKSSAKAEDDNAVKTKKKNTNSNKKHGDDNNDAKAAVDKRFKTLPRSESLPRNETVAILPLQRELEKI